MTAPDAVLAGLDTPAPVPDVLCLSSIDDTGIRIYAVRTATHQRCCVGCGTVERPIQTLVLLRAAVELCEPCSWQWVAQERAAKGVA